MKDKPIILACAIILALVTFILGCNMGEAHAESAAMEYYDNTEALLDSIYSWDESFMDTVMESDAYYEYEVAKEVYAE